MAVNLSPLGGAAAQFFDNDGNVLSGGKIYTYLAGTSTPAATYTTSAGSIAHANPIILDSSGRVPGGEIWVTVGTTYKFTLKNSTDVLIGTYDNITSQFNTDASLVSYTPAGTGAVATNVQAKLRQVVNVLDYGADPTGVLDSTAAFTNAQGTLGDVQVNVPPGTYLLNGLEIKDGVSLIGSNKSAVIFQQKLTSTPAIYVVSNATTNPNQVKNLNLSGFTVRGVVGSSVPAVYFIALSPYAIWNSKFDYCAQDTYGALGMLPNSIVFQCSFTIQSETTSGPAVETVAGYSVFDLFLTQCNGMALIDNGGGNTFARLVSDGAYSSSGQNSTFITPTTEYFWASTIPQNCWFLLTGFAQTIITPQLNLDATQSLKINACIKPFASTVVINPNFICTVANPFATSTGQKFSIVGPGVSSCINKIETIYDGSSNNFSMRNVSLVGDCSSVASTPTERNTSQIQYLAPTTTFNFQINPNTGIIIWEPTGTIATANMSFLGSFVPTNGQTWTISTTQIITTVDWTGITTGNTSLLPTTLAANSKFTFIYNATQNKYYLI
jgi:hypothetical protein